MNTMQKYFVRWTLIGFAFGAAIGFCIGKAHSADLPLPRPRPAPELCLQDGRQPFPGQTLIVDKTCPSGLRWRVQK